jgi:hypothetical protein
MTIVHEDLIKACKNAAGQDEEQLRSWAAVLRKNGINTAQDWLTVKKSTPLKMLIEIFGAALVGYLDELAGVPGACCVARCLSPSPAPLGM